MTIEISPLWHASAPVMPRMLGTMPPSRRGSRPLHRWSHPDRAGSNGPPCGTGLGPVELDLASDDDEFFERRWRTQSRGVSVSRFTGRGSYSSSQQFSECHEDHG